MRAVASGPSSCGKPTASAPVTERQRAAAPTPRRIFTSSANSSRSPARPLSAQTVEDRARAAAEASRAKTSDSDAIQQNYLTPGLAGQPISTVDNSRTFNPNIACQKTATLLELIAQPAATGDIGTLRISRDKDLDGSFDQLNKVSMIGILTCA